MRLFTVPCDLCPARIPVTLRLLRLAWTRGAIGHCAACRASCRICTP
jgi:hypothetical protein